MADYLNGMTVHLLWLANKITFKGWQDIRQTKGNHTFYWIYGGKGVFRTDRTHAVGRGTLVYMPPGQELHMQSSHDDPLVMMIARFECIVSVYAEEERTWSMSSLERLELPDLRHCEGETALRFNRLFDELVHNWVPSREGGVLLSKSRLLEIVELAHREASAERSGDPAYSAFLQVKTILEEQFHKPLQVYELAATHSLSPSYLRKLFQTRLGISPKAYLDKIRNDHAIRYLSYTDMPVRVVALSCGYGDEFQFSKAFKKTNGCTPTSFRARQSTRLER
ncbi:MAG: transcriptional regulator, AraC family protein [Paenibacillus sp.]|jgi:AraC-like DNA-binding protein|nr:transcriptional regulator, AraC family protein [Paenibacillus sp.]